jgi:hypothetical protein
MTQDIILLTDGAGRGMKTGGANIVEGDAGKAVEAVPEEARATAGLDMRLGPI